MKCPACQFVCSDLRDICPKCFTDLRPQKELLGLPVSNAKASYGELVEQVSHIRNKQSGLEKKHRRPAKTGWFKRLWQGGPDLLNSSEANHQDTANKHKSAQTHGIDDEETVSIFELGIARENANSEQTLSHQSSNSTTTAPASIDHHKQGRDLSSEVTEDFIIANKETTPVDSSPTQPAPQILDLSTDAEGLDDLLDSIIGDTQLEYEAIKISNSNIDIEDKNEQGIEIDIEIDLEDEDDQLAATTMSSDEQSPASPSVYSLPDFDQDPELSVAELDAALADLTSSWGGEELTESDEKIALEEPPPWSEMEATTTLKSNSGLDTVTTVEPSQDDDALTTDIMATDRATACRDAESWPDALAASVDNQDICIQLKNEADKSAILPVEALTPKITTNRLGLTLQLSYALSGATLNSSLVPPKRLGYTPEAWAPLPALASVSNLPEALLSLEDSQDALVGVLASEKTSSADVNGDLIGSWPTLEPTLEDPPLVCSPESWCSLVGKTNATDYSEPDLELDSVLDLEAQASSVEALSVSCHQITQSKQALSNLSITTCKLDTKIAPLVVELTNAAIVPEVDAVSNSGIGDYQRCAKVPEVSPATTNINKQTAKKSEPEWESCWPESNFEPTHEPLFNDNHGIITHPSDQEEIVGLFEVTPAIDSVHVRPHGWEDTEPKPEATPVDSSEVEEEPINFNPPEPDNNSNNPEAPPPTTLIPGLIWPEPPSWLEDKPSNFTNNSLSHNTSRGAKPLIDQPEIPLELTAMLLHDMQEAKASTEQPDSITPSTADKDLQTWPEASPVTPANSDTSTIIGTVELKQLDIISDNSSLEEPAPLVTIAKVAPKGLQGSDTRGTTSISDAQAPITESHLLATPMTITDSGVDVDLIANYFTTAVDELSQSELESEIALDELYSIESIEAVQALFETAKDELGASFSKQRTYTEKVTVEPVAQLPAQELERQLKATTDALTGSFIGLKTSKSDKIIDEPAVRGLPTPPSLFAHLTAIAIDTIATFFSADLLLLAYLHLIDNKLTLGLFDFMYWTYYEHHLYMGLGLGAFLVALLLYPLISLTIWRKTLGHHLSGIRVYDRTGRPANFQQLILRSLSLPLSLLLLGFIRPFLGHRAWHDIIAGTVLGNTPEVVITEPELQQATSPL